MAENEASSYSIATLNAKTEDEGVSLKYGKSISCLKTDNKRPDIPEEFHNSDKNLSLSICDNKRNSSPKHSEGVTVLHNNIVLGNESSGLSNNQEENVEPLPGSSNEDIKEDSSDDHTVWLPSTKIKKEFEDNDSKFTNSDEDEESEEELGEEERLEEESDDEMDDESNGGAYHLAEVSYGEENEDSQNAGGTETDTILGISHDLKNTTSPRLETIDGLSSKRQLATDFIIRRRNVKITNLKSGKVNYKNFECLICGYKAPQRSSLIDHIHKHTGEKVHHCLHCDKKFRYKSYLAQHITVYHTDFQAQFTCKLCGRRFLKESAFIRHERTHSGERPFPCDYCDYQARHRGALKEHLRTHTGEKPYKCNKCSYTCAYSTLLKRHFAKHHEVKTYSCQYCKYVTKQIRNLNDHLKMHSGDKFYYCDNCSYKSIRKDSLKAHIVNIHSNESLSCSVCGAKFKYSKSLNKHTYEHHPDKFPHKCELCDIRFKQPRGLALHNGKQHPQEKS